MTGKKLYNNGLPRKSPDENIKHLRKIECDHIADCDDCGLTSVLNRRVHHTLNSTPFPHWRKKCNCGRYENPITGEWLEVSCFVLNKLIRHQAKSINNLLDFQEKDK